MLSTSYFGYFGHVRSLPSKKIIPTCRDFDAYLQIINLFLQCEQ